MPSMVNHERNMMTSKYVIGDRVIDVDDLKLDNPVLGTIVERPSKFNSESTDGFIWIRWDTNKFAGRYRTKYIQKVS